MNDGSRGGDASDGFAHERPRLWAMAYRMLGSRVDADDVVQEAWLRWNRMDPVELERPAAWLTTVTSRLAIDRLRRRKAETEGYVGPWLPEPIVTSPEDPVEMAESITVGFLAVMERLDPVERVVFLLADVFGEPYQQIAEIVGRTPDACRQVASRARRRVRDPNRRAQARPTHARQLALLGAFAAAAAGGDMTELIGVLAADVVLTSDGGPHRHAARRPVVGADRVARLVVNLASRVPSTATMRIETINGAPGLIVDHDGTVFSALIIHADEGQIDEIYVIVNPDKLRSLV